MRTKIFNIILFYFCFCCNVLNEKKKYFDNLDGIIKNDEYTVTKIISRPETYYTQGIYFDDNGKSLIESGGLYGESVLVKMDYPSLKINKKVNLSPKYFGEGIAKCGDNIYQLTWQEMRILRYSKQDMKFVDTVELPVEMKEGWGLSESGNPNELIATDGSSHIYFLDCNNDLKVKKKITVTMDDIEVPALNSLTYANGHFWSNKYYSNKIYKINPNNGRVVKTYDMSPLVDYELNKKTLTNFEFQSGYVLNGITYDKTNQKFLLTGKKWGHYYEVNFDN